MIFTNADSVQPDDPIDIDVADIEDALPNRGDPNVGTTIVMQNGTVFHVKEDFETVEAMRHDSSS